jgi:SNF2 family DNA or RNA helicase
MAGQAHVSLKHRRFVVPYDERIAGVIPECRELFAPEHGRMLAVPHTLEATRFARNCGFKVGAPINYYYDWNRSKPFHTQRVTAAMLTMNPRAFVLSEMGTGKTRAALFAIDHLIFEERIRCALIIAPLSTLSAVWDREIFQYFRHLKTIVLYGSRAERLAKLKEDAHIYIINHDGVSVIREALVAKENIDCIVIDEVAAFRNARTERWKNLNNVVNKRKFVWGLTGSPTPNEPPDAYGQVKLLMPHKVPRHFSHFKKATMRQVSQFRWVAKPDANDTVFELFQPAVRFRRDECVELPPVSFTAREVEFSTRQQEVYDKLSKHLRYQYAQGEITAANEGVLFSKLLQISAGWVYTSHTREIMSLDPAPRLNALEGVLDETIAKVIVFVDFIHAAHEVYKHLLTKKYDVALVTGSTPKAQRDVQFRDFQNTSFLKVLVAHPKCMSHGLTLTAASTIVWYTPTTSLETYEQACARITRPGQDNKQLIVHLTGSKIEVKLYKRLQAKADLQGALLEMFEEGESL